MKEILKLDSVWECPTHLSSRSMRSRSAASRCLPGLRSRNSSINDANLPGVACAPCRGVDVCYRARRTAAGTRSSINKNESLLMSNTKRCGSANATSTGKRLRTGVFVRWEWARVYETQNRCVSLPSVAYCIPIGRGRARVGEGGRGGRGEGINSGIGMRTDGCA